MSALTDNPDGNPVRTVHNYLLALIAGLGFTVPTFGNVEAYYAGIDTATSATLRQELHQLVAEQRYISYKQVWKFLAQAHEAGPDSILLFYTPRVVEKSARASGSFQSENDYWNREHIWPQSKGLKRTDARRDLHNIVPTDRSVNSSRGNKYFDDGGAPHSECRLCFTDRDSWEPPDQVKGDIARILFYMDLRYDGNDLTNTPDLVAFDGVSSDKRYFRGLATLQRWHCKDRVSTVERTRNDVVHNYQGNRNPFVDYPSLVEHVFGFSCNNP